MQSGPDFTSSAGQQSGNCSCFREHHGGYRITRTAQVNMAMAGGGGIRNSLDTATQTQRVRAPAYGLLDSHTWHVDSLRRRWQWRRHWGRAHTTGNLYLDRDGNFWKRDPYVPAHACR